MRALSNVSLPHVAQANEHNRASAERSNESRLNQNFRIIQGTIAEMELEQDNIKSRLDSLEGAPVGIEADRIYDNVNWRVVEMNTGDVFATEKTDTIILNTSTTSGGMFYGDTSVALPAGLASVSTVQVTAECDSDPIFAVVKNYSTSSVDIRIVSTTSGIHTFILYVTITGKV